MDVFFLVGVLACALLLVFVVQLVRIALSDCDLRLRGCQLKPEYFAKKNVWIVGASGAIGEALCRQLSSHGANLILSGLPQELEKMQALKDSLERPQDVRIVTLDLCDSQSLHSKAEEAKKAFGHIDILLLTAGILQWGFFKTLPESLDRKIFEVVYFGQRNLIQAVLPDMLDRKSGHIVVLSSSMAKLGSVLSTSYTAAKCALTGLLDTLVEEIRSSDVKITTVFPSGVKTPLLVGALLNSGRPMIESHPNCSEMYERPFMKGQLLSPHRCAELILIAASNQLEEAWLSKIVTLSGFYLKQYAPSLFFYWRRLISHYLIDMMKDVL